jgi:lactoylglutathione lyase
MLGYADGDSKTAVLELTYNYGITEYSKGNAYAQVFMEPSSETFL